MELRLKNALKTGEETPSGVKIKSSALSESIKSAAELAGWSEKRNSMQEGHGLGMACNGFLSGPRARRLPRQEEAYAFSATIIRAHGDGRATVITGSADLGQGSDSVMAQIAAEELGISFNQVSVIAGDTEIAPLDLGSYGSRVTMMAGNATLKAASDLKNKILDAVAAEMEIDKEDLTIRDDLIQVKGSPQKNVTFSDGVIICQKSLGGKPVIGEGYHNPEDEGVLDPVALCEQGVGNYSPTYSFGTHLTEVEVDRETGEVDVKRVIASHDGGVAINPMAVEGQLEGSVSMGHGYAISEEAKYDNGLMMNPNFLEYKLPLSVDSSPVDIILNESVDPEGPFGAKEAGEGPVSPTAPSIANAIHNATGVWIKELPVNPEKILKAMKEKE
jgi:4-hydroxybenzoyl-CoA reductase subunit alpha